MGSVIKRKYINGSVIEPVIAIVILIITFGMALTILARLNSAIPVKAINKANEMINNEVFETLNNSNFLDKEVEEDSFWLEKEVKLNEETGIIEISFRVFDRNRKIIANKIIHKTNYSLSSPEIDVK